MDLSKAMPVTQVRKKEENFILKWKPQKKSFVVSHDLFLRLSLLTHSLTQIDDPVNKQVGFEICPGDDGKFFKLNGKATKKKEFINTTLSDMLTAYGVTGPNLDLILEGQINGNDVYRIVDENQSEPEDTQVQAQDDEQDGSMTSDQDTVPDDTMPEENNSAVDAAAAIELAANGVNDKF